MHDRDDDYPIRIHRDGMNVKRIAREGLPLGETAALNEWHKDKSGVRCDPPDYASDMDHD